MITLAEYTRDYYVAMLMQLEGRSHANPKLYFTTICSWTLKQLADRFEKLTEPVLAEREKERE